MRKFSKFSINYSSPSTEYFGRVPEYSITRKLSGNRVLETRLGNPNVEC
jgi:hypothetical protein